LQQSTFVAVFEGVLIGGRVTYHDYCAATQTHQPWYSLLYEVAQQCGTGQSITEASYGHRFRHLEKGSIAGCMLATLPILMLNLDDHGHRRAFVSQWAKQLALSEATVTALVGLFDCLCHLQSSHAIRRYGSRQTPWVAHLPSTESSTAILVDIYELLARVQGQLVPGLQIARRQGWEGAEMGLLALLAVVNSGSLAIPLNLRRALEMALPHIHQPDGLNQPYIHQFSDLNQQKQLWQQVSTRLYQQWIGLSPDHDETRTWIPAAVTI
jgi:hypothetical protein